MVGIYFGGNDFATVSNFQQRIFLNIFGRTHVFEKVIFQPLKISSKNFEEFRKELEKVYHH